MSKSIILSTWGAIKCYAVSIMCETMSPKLIRRLYCYAIIIICSQSARICEPCVVCVRFEVVLEIPHDVSRRLTLSSYPVLLVIMLVDGL